VLPPGLDPGRVRAIFIDLDGTVLTKSRPSPAVAPAIARVEAGGVRCVIATGRMLTSARRIGAELGVTAPVVCYQGAVVAESGDGGAVLRHEPLDLPVARELIAAIEAEGHDVVAFVEEAVYVSRPSDTAEAYSRGAGVPYHVVGELADWLAEPVTKLVTMGDPEVMDRLRDDLHAHFDGRAFIAKSLPHYLEAAAPGVSKASGADLVCELLGVEASDCVAIGDGENDLELLDWAGFSIAVEGGFPELLARADWICPPLAEDGVPRVLEAIADARASTIRA
jgi:Cof subfamily protein (haloacid dehalogenase superfamily)